MLQKGVRGSDTRYLYGTISLKAFFLFYGENPVQRELFLASDEFFVYGYLMLILQPALPLQESYPVKMRMKVKLGMGNGGWLKGAPNMLTLDNFLD